MGSTSEHATTPEHPCPGVVARTGPQAVKPSPVSGESMTSGGCACGRASRHQPHRGTPPTLPALHRNLATEPRSTGSEASGPGAPSSPGPHPDRAGGGDNNRSTGPMVTQGNCSAGAHPTSTCQGPIVALEPLRSNKRTPRSRVDRPAGAFAPQTERPRGPPSRGRSSST